ncbi:response regulator, partial [archaeon]
LALPTGGGAMAQPESYLTRVYETASVPSARARSPPAWCESARSGLVISTSHSRDSYLPSDSSEAGGTPSVCASAPTSPRPRVLVADDDATSRRLILRHLAALGWDATLVEDGTDVLRALCERGQLSRDVLRTARVQTPPTRPAVAATSGSRTDDVPPLAPTSAPLPFDVVLLDIVMTDMHGDETCQCIRRAGCALPIVAVTANAFVQGSGKLLSSGFDAVVPKPFSRTELRAALERVAPSLSAVAAAIALTASPATGRALSTPAATAAGRTPLS